MSDFHIANTSFDVELENRGASFFELVTTSAIFRQLQFLPFLYGSNTDLVFTSDKPNPDYLALLRKEGFSPPKRYEQEKIQNLRLNCWGETPSVTSFAKEHRLVFHETSLELLQHIHSKACAFAMRPPVKGSLIIEEETTLLEWMQRISLPFVIKSPFGFSGKGKVIVDSEEKKEKARVLAQKVFLKHQPVIGEPWLNKILDFSTQWWIDTEIQYLGATVCLNDEKGRYIGSLVGEEEILFGSYLPFLLEHKAVALAALKKIQALGYQGHIGFDALLYQEKKILLQPLVEINARKTMGWVALQLYKKQQKGLLHLFLSSHSSCTPLLPLYVEDPNERRITFRNNLFARHIENDTFSLSPFGKF